MAGIIAHLRLICLALVAIAGLNGASAAPFAPRLQGTTTSVQKIAQVAPYQCGVTSSKFARICRPQAHTSCRSAAARGVKGFSPQFCSARRIACSTCLAMLRRCISRIGHGPRSEFSCEECTGKFSRCIGKRYPAVRG